MHAPRREQGRYGHIRRAAGDLIFRLTTYPLSDPAAAAAGLLKTRALLAETGWTVRCAGPRWFILWREDEQRLSRLRVVILPGDYIGLNPRETAFLLASQLRERGLSQPDRAALWTSPREIWAKLAAALRSG